jgi:hypothetical protein
MTMLFRRVRDHVAHQDWTAIGIDFLIVVAGVFVGTQVSNWNSERLEQRRAQGYLVRILANLQDDQAGMKAALAYWGDVIRYGEAAIAYADEDRLDGGSRWKTVLAFYQASQLLPFRMNDTTYQELRSAGDLGLIRDAALRDALAAYYVTGALPTSPHLMEYNPEYRNLVRGYTPTPVSDYIWKQCVVHMGTQDEAFDPDCASSVSDAEAQAILDRFEVAPGLLPALRFWVTNQKVAYEVVRGSIEDAKALEHQVAAAAR